MESRSKSFGTDARSRIGVMKSPDADARPPFDAIVLAGGTSSRMGGRDKAQAEVGGRRLIDRALDAVADADRVVVVGPRRPVGRDVLWAREAPPGGGPTAAIAAGLDQARGEVVVVLAVDMPTVDRAIVRTLVESIGDHDGAALVGPAGQLQVLAAAYRTTLIRSAVAGLADTWGVAVRSALANLRIKKVPFEHGDIDCDTSEDLVAAERVVRERE